MKLKNRLKNYTTKLTLLLSSLTLCLGACTPIAKGGQTDKDLKYKFRGVNGVVLSMDAYQDHHFVTITNEQGSYIASPGRLGKGRGGYKTMQAVTIQSLKPLT